MRFVCPPRGITVLALCTILQAGARAEPFKQAEVTQTVNIVSLLPEMQSPRAASIGDIVSGRTALTTAEASRAELQFPDLTITRIGANALFRFLAGGREMVLDGGTMLFHSPKGAGGGKVEVGAITAAVTGTDFLVSYVKGPASKGGRVKVISLSHTVLVFFTANPRERRLLRPGEMLDIPNGATSFPPVVTVSLSLIISSNELLAPAGFGPLPSQPLLKELAESQQKKTVKLPGASEAEEEALRSAFGTLETRGLNATTAIEATGQVAGNSAAVETLLEQVARAISSDESFIRIVGELARSYPTLPVSIARGATGGMPRLAPTIAATVATLFPKQAIAIAYAVAEDVPGDARAIGQAVAAVVPDQQKEILTVVGATTQDVKALGSALALLASRGLDSAAISDAVDQVANNPALVELVMAQVARGVTGDEALVTVLGEVARQHPTLAVSIAKGAAEGVPRLAPTIAAAVATIFPKQAVAIAYAVAEAAPGDARAIAEAVAAVAPDAQRELLGIPDAIARREQALQSALAVLEARGLDMASVVEAVGQVVNDPALVESLTGYVARTSPSDEAFILIMEGIARQYPSLAISIATGAAEALPRLGPTIAATLAAIFPQQATSISGAVAKVAPDDARAIAQAVAAVVPDQRDVIFAVVRSALGLNGELAELDLSFGQGINPANFQPVTAPLENQQEESSVEVISPEN